MDDRACAGTDPSVFTPVTITASELAEIRRANCDRCPVRAECLAYGNETRESGIYGGQFLVRGRAKRYAGPKRGQRTGSGHAEATQSLAEAAGKRACDLLRQALPFMNEAQLARTESEALRLRLAYPWLDAGRLGELARPPATRHAMNGRLRRVREAAECALASAPVQAVAS
jgi:hypothetical protein